MQAIRLHDRIRVTAKGRAGLFGGVRIRLTASDPSGQPALDIPAGEDNLAYRAALCLAEHFCPTKGNQIHIHIEKSIPVAAGLAGGSADAAAVFLSLAALWHLNGGLNPLLALGAKLGADIPFCISAIASGNPDLGFSEDPLAAPAALAEGIGEILTPLPTQGGQVHLLKPRCPHRPTLSDVRPAGGQSRGPPGICLPPRPRHPNWHPLHAHGSKGHVQRIRTPDRRRLAGRRPDPRLPEIRRAGLRLQSDDERKRPHRIPLEAV